MLVSHVLLGVAVWALGGAGWRIAGRAGLDGTERAIAAATVGTTAAIVEALALGRVGAAGSTAALVAAAVVTWLVAQRLVGATAGRSWWPSLSRAERAGVCAGAGALVALVAWLLRHPAIGVDGVYYHLPEVAGWVARGDTGATPHVSAEFATGSYPLTNEVVLAWATGLAHSFSPIAAWAAASVALLGASLWALLRRGGCGRVLTALGAGAVLALPLVALQLNTPKNDLPALAWLAACAALATVGRPGALGVAVLAGGLAVGSKTSTAPLVVVALVAGAWACRDRRRELVRPLAWGAAGALVAGGVWYVRNVVVHGWPTWPVAGPVGDPQPVYLRRIDPSFLSRPRATLEGRIDVYARVLAGGLALVAGGVLAPLVARRRAVLATAAGAALSLLAWGLAPFTGRADSGVLDLSLSTTRYLLPALAAGAVGLALAGRTSRIARAVLAAAVVWSVIRTAQLGFPVLPAAATLLAGAVAGAAIGLLRPPRAVAASVAVVGGAVLLANGGDGWLSRHATTAATSAAPVERLFADAPGWAERREPVAFSPQVVGPIAGDRLRHAVSLIAPDESCRSVRRLARRGYVVIERVPYPQLLAPTTAPGCLAGATPIAAAGAWRVYGPRLRSGA